MDGGCHLVKGKPVLWFVLCLWLIVRYVALTLKTTQCNCSAATVESHYLCTETSLCAMQMVFQQNQHITKLDYDEAGPTVVHKKCS